MASLALLAALAGSAWTQPLAWPEASPEPRWQPTDAWCDADFAVLSSELSPAVLISCKSSTLRLFVGLEQWGLGGPTRLALRGPDRVEDLTPPVTVEGEDMRQPWLYVSFRGAEGWDQWDEPWLVVLQHRPTRAVADASGLRLDFPGEAGLIVTMPLYGAHKLIPIEGADGYEAPNSRAQAALAPMAAADRCQLWSRMLRYWPLNAREEVKIVPGKDTLRLQCTVEHVEIQDDWATRGVKTAPLPPTLALALTTGFPARVSGQEQTTGLPSAYGPYMAVRGDSYTIDFPLLQYVNETETQQPPNMDDPVVALAAQEVARRMERKFSDGELERIWDHGGGNNYCWQVMGDRYYAKALAYAPQQARENARACMAKYVREWILNEAKYKPFRGKLILEGPGIGNWGGYDDSGKFSSNILETLWWYAHYAGDWDVIRERWDTVQKLFITPRECRWRGFGRDAIAEMGDEAAPPMCMARMAYAIGDMDTYAYSAYIYARELVHLWVKTQPQCAEWFRSTQPWEGGEPMKGPIWLTNLWGDVAGWRIDGPDYPKETGERQCRNRWVRFGNEDVARFFREHMGEIVHQELDWWATREDSPYKPGVSTAHIAPSMEQLRSLLLNESPEELAKLTPIEDARIGRAADAISYYLSFIRTGRPVQYERLVPKDLPESPWTLGLERESDGSDGSLVVRVSTKEGHWPALSDWRAWKPPKAPADLPGADRWSYGQIIAGNAPPNLKWERLSWTTNVWHDG